MSEADKKRRVGFTCAYTPLPLIHAAGFVPFRMLPEGDSPDQAGSVLHDNLCPHVKRVLDRRLADDLPDLAGVVIMNSCDAMRRLADGWRASFPKDRVELVDLPLTQSQGSRDYFEKELARFRAVLEGWSGSPVTDDAIRESVGVYNRLSEGLNRAREATVQAGAVGGWARLQELLNRSVTDPPETTIQAIDEMGSTEPGAGSASVRLFLIGNVLPDPEAFVLFEECGAQVVADDLCTGSRQMARVDLNGEGSVLGAMAAALLKRSICARTLDLEGPSALARTVVERALACSAKGVVAHVIKFCDPYLSRLPAVREALKEKGIPMLALEGDCTLRSLGQHRTRIEAFVEMLV